MGFSIFPNTYAEVILLRLCERNINAFLTAVNGGLCRPYGRCASSADDRCGRNTVSLD